MSSKYNLRNFSKQPENTQTPIPQRQTQIDIDDETWAKFKAIVTLDKDLPTLAATLGQLVTGFVEERS